MYTVKLSLSLLVIASTTILRAEVSSEFLKYWKSGLAELSSYSIVTERYGELRKAQGVLIFVYEEINADTRIKVESDKTPPARRVPVLKLNNILKFNTGIYDYSVMTSVFSGLEGPGVDRAFLPRKVSLTVQEWCGHVYHHVEGREKALVSEMHSYFESEGNARDTIPLKGEPLYYEDELPILLRELDGILFKEGESREVTLVPSLWTTRKRHKPLSLVRGQITKLGPEKIRTAAGNFQTIKWKVETGGVQTEYFVENSRPRKLVAWKNSLGESGELLASLRKTYWELNHNKDEELRKNLGLPYHKDGGR